MREIGAATEPRIAVLGLGYVGLPLAVAFAEKFACLGFDINQQRMAQLRQGIDTTRELVGEELLGLKALKLSSDPTTLAWANVFVIAVPTPIDRDHRPDLTPLVRASEMVGKFLTPGDLVIYESTVYPGCTEEDCVPVLERVSGLTMNREFFVGYSPERINPGDMQRRVRDIVKVTSGSTPEAAQVVDQLYKAIVRAGTHLAPSIRVAEAAKVIENTQRDVAIALANEFAMLFARLGLDSKSVLDAAATKWNFINMRPGMVGGHCIGVDPYYLMQCAQRHGVAMPIVSSARAINEQMPRFVVAEIIRIASRKGLSLHGARSLILGVTFKENCADLRNTKVFDLRAELIRSGASVDVHDPIADSASCAREYGFELIAEPAQAGYDIVVLAVAHAQFVALGASRLRAFGKANHVLFDIKQMLRADEVDGQL